MAEDTDLGTDLEVTGAEARLPPDVELGAFRIAQEAVRNTIRHAGAREVRVAVGFEPDGLVLVVADDGRGFTPESAELTSGHLGLLGMTERASLLGGHLEVHSAPGKGTRVRATLPVGAPRTGPGS